MPTMRLKKQDGTWDKVPVLGSYQAVLAVNEAATNAQNAAKEVKEIYGDGNFTPLSDLLGGLGTKLKRWGTIFANKVFATNLPIVYNSVAEMKADTLLWEGMNIKTLGYYEPNDGGGASFLIRTKADSDVDDGGSLHELANGLVAELIIENGTVCPEQFGAVGDEATDDTDAIQKALESKAQCVSFKSKYVISKRLVISGNIKLIGCPSSKIIINQQVKILKGIGCNRETQAKNIYIDGLNLVGYCSSDTEDESGLVAIELLEAANVTINNCSFDGFNKNIELTECSKSNITNNVILNATETAGAINGYGILLETCIDTKIYCNKFYGIERHAIYVNGCTHTTITSNHIEGQTLNLDRFSHYEGNIKINGAKDVIVENNTIIGNYYGIGLMKSFSSNVGCENVIINGNIVRDMITADGIPGGGIGTMESQAVHKNIVVSNNTLIANPTNGALSGIFFDLGSGENISIIGNQCSGFFRGIRRAGAFPCLISNNYVKDCTTGYDLDSADYVILGDNNYFEDCTNGITQLPFTTTRYWKLGAIKECKKQEGVQITSSKFNACVSNLFWVAGNAKIVIDGIFGGFDGQVITIFTNGAGSFKLSSSNYSLLKLNGDFIAGSGPGQITLMMNNGTWYELSRTQGLT